MTTPITKLDELADQQDSPHATVNEAFRQLEGRTVKVKSKTTTAEPGSPAEGDSYVIPASATGTNWSTYTQDDIAQYIGGAWQNVTPVEGWRVWVDDEDLVSKYNGTDWVGAITEDVNNNVTVGEASLATTATDGFLYIPSCAGTPTGTPTSKTGFAPLVIDSTNNKLYAYIGGAWRVMN